MPLELIETVSARSKKEMPTIEINEDSEESVDEQFKRQTYKLEDFMMENETIRNAAFRVPADSDFLSIGEGRLNELDFLPDSNLERIGKFLIEKYYEKDFSHLVNANIIYLWKRKGGESGGAVTLGKCVKPAGLVKHFASAKDAEEDEEIQAVDYVIWCAADHARTHQMKLRDFQALIYHELLHTRMTGGKFVVRTHEFEGFSREIQEFGFWKNDIKKIAEACKDVEFKQQGLF